MTRNQRRAHLAIWLILTPLMLVTIAYAVTQRPDAGTVRTMHLDEAQ